jgi:hypothetical protein
MDFKVQPAIIKLCPVALQKALGGWLTGVLQFGYISNYLLTGIGAKGIIHCDRTCGG